MYVLVMFCEKRCFQDSLLYKKMKVADQKSRHLENNKQKNEHHLSPLFGFSKISAIKITNKW